eukprot:scaffold149838_cov43-Tisochrysis_lutea.AAC.2
MPKLAKCQVSRPVVSGLIPSKQRDKNQQSWEIAVRSDGCFHPKMWQKSLMPSTWLGQEKDGVDSQYRTQRPSPPHPGNGSSYPRDACFPITGLGIAINR